MLKSAKTSCCPLAVLSIIEMARKRSAELALVPHEEQLSDAPPDLRRALVTCSTRSGLTRALTLLQRSGVLRGPDTERSTRYMLQRSAIEHGQAQTPYGRVVQMIRLPMQKSHFDWEYCNPFAYLYYISTLAVGFGKVMKECVRPGRHIDIIVYIDEVCPGNPLRFEQARKLQSIYWCILQWPEWLISRTALWPTLGVIRSRIVEDLEGGVSNLHAIILNIFFGAAQAHNFSIGVNIRCGGEARLCLKGEYSGTMADEKALKEINDYKGAGGIRFCMSCGNIQNTVDEEVLPPGAVPLHARNLENCVRLRNEDIWYMADQLRAMAIANRSYKELEKRYGLKYNPHGTIFQMSLRMIYRPAEHYIRDWMHVIVSGGVGNVQVGLVMNELEDHNLRTSMVQDFGMSFVLPQKYGKVQPAWLDNARVHEESFTSFAAVMLSVLPIVLEFLLQGVQPHGFMLQSIACFSCLVDIVQLLSLGADAACNYLDLLERLVKKHHDLWFEAYGSRGVKPKWHHMLHLAETYRMLGKVISCFAAERKHRRTKRAALHVFRHLEHTCLADVITQQCDQISTFDFFKPQFLVHGQPHVFFGIAINRATESCLLCGHIHRGDVVYTRDGAVCEICCFWQSLDVDGDAPIIAQCIEYDKVGDKTYLATERQTFVDAGSIVDAMTYRRLSDSSIQVLLPFVARSHG